MGKISISVNPRYLNVEKTVNFQKDNCTSTDQTGSVVPYVVPAGMFTSLISQADADGKALAEANLRGQDFANTRGTCTTTRFWNVAKQKTYTKNDCNSGYTGGTYVYKVDAHTYSAATQAQADALAQNDVDTKGQTAANTNAVCSPATLSPRWVLDESASYCEIQYAADETGIIVVDIYGLSPNAELYGRILDTISETSYRVHTGNNFAPPDLKDNPAQCLMLASDYVGNGGNLTWRFECNIAKLLALYPDRVAFSFGIYGVVGGPAVSVGGAYSLKGADQGSMVMLGTPGSYIPSNAQTNSLGLTQTVFPIKTGTLTGTYNDKPLIVSYTYNRTNKTITQNYGN